MSPGAVTEKMYMFIAEYSDEMKVNSGGGVDTEDEDIEVLEIPFQEAIKMMQVSKLKMLKLSCCCNMRKLITYCKCKN